MAVIPLQGKTLEQFCCELAPHPLATGIKEYIEGLQKPLSMVAEWEIFSKDLTLNLYKAQVTLRFVGERNLYHYSFRYVDPNM